MKWFETCRQAYISYFFCRWTCCLKHPQISILKWCQTTSFKYDFLYLQREGKKRSWREGDRVPSSYHFLPGQCVLNINFWRGCFQRGLHLMFNISFHLPSIFFIWRKIVSLTLQGIVLVIWGESTSCWLLVLICFASISAMLQMSWRLHSLYTLIKMVDSIVILALV